MAPLPRPLLRFAVGTTLLAPAACTSAGDERPPNINMPAPQVESDGGAAPQAPELEKVNTPPDPDSAGEAPEAPEEPPVINTPAPEDGPPTATAETTGTPPLGEDKVIEISTNTPPERTRKPKPVKPIINTPKPSPLDDPLK